MSPSTSGATRALLRHGMGRPHRAIVQDAAAVLVDERVHAVQVAVVAGRAQGARLVF